MPDSSPSAPPAAAGSAGSRTLPYSLAKTFTGNTPNRGIFTMQAEGRWFLFVPQGEHITPIVHLDGPGMPHGDRYALWLTRIPSHDTPYEVYELYINPVHY